jgi:hypothetical protein
MGPYKRVNDRLLITLKLRTFSDIHVLKRTPAEFHG